MGAQLNHEHPGLGRGTLFSNFNSGENLSIRTAEKASRFSGASALAKIIEGEAGGPLSEALKTQGSFAQAYAALSAPQQAAIQKKFGDRSLEEIQSLAKEKDATLFYSGLLNLGLRFEDDDRLDLAGTVYAALGSFEGLPTAVQKQAKTRLDAMTGHGATGYRIAFLAERIHEHSASPSAIFSMGVAGGLFKVSRLAFMGRLAGSPIAKPLANLLAFGVETAGFTTASKLSSAALGVQQDWSPEAWFHEWASGGMMLAGLKVTGALAGQVAKRYAQGPGALERFSQVAMPQFGMFGGILLGNKFAELGGFKTPAEGETWITDAFATLLEFNISGNLTKQAFGKGFARFEGEMEAKTDALTQGHFQEALAKWGNLFKGPEPWEFAHAMSMVGGENGHTGRPWTLHQPMQMTGLKPEEGGGEKNAISHVPTLHPRAELVSLEAKLMAAVDFYLKGLEPTDPLHLASLDLLHANAEVVRDSLLGKDFSYLKPEQWDRLAELLRPPEFKIVTKPEMKRVFINNRGEIAVRLSRAMLEENIKPIVLVTEIEAKSSWAKAVEQMGAEIRVVTFAEAEKALGKAASPQDLFRFTYQNIDRVIADALQLKADAVHPGYGYISENAEFAAKLAGKDLALIGPSAKSMEEAGDKDVAKQNFIKAGVPVALGTAKGYLDVNELVTEVNRLGLKYPLRLKAVGGGGGRGQATVYNEGELRKVFDQKKAEAEAAFNNGHLMAEVFVPSFHHVEFQIMADRFGNTVIVGERECTLQVGDQKLIEIHPAEIFNRIPGLKEKMYAAAKLASESVNYTGHGTVEFMVNPETGDFYALEVNARIQVEHRVSELVSGVDLIREGVRVAKGLPLSFRQEDIQLQGAAVEIRLKAVKPSKQWESDKQRWKVLDMPRPGVITRFQVPEWEGVHVESSVGVGDQVSPYADPMIAKVIVTGRDRAHALQRAIHVLEATQLEGNQGFESDLPRQLALLKTEAVRRGTYDNNFVTDWTLRAEVNDKKSFKFWDDRANPKHVHQTYLTRNGEFTPVSLEIASNLSIQEQVPEQIRTGLQRLLRGKEAAGEFQLPGPVADLLRQDEALRHEMMKPQPFSHTRFWVQSNEGGEIRQVLAFEDNRPRRMILTQKAPVRLPGDAPQQALSRDFVYDVQFSANGQSVESARLYLHGEKGLHLLETFPKGDRPFTLDMKAENEVGLFVLPMRGKAGEASNGRGVQPTALRIKFIPTRLMTGLEVRNPNGDLLVSFTPEKIMESPSQRFTALVALAESIAPEGVKKRAKEQVEALVRQVADLPAKDPIREKFIEELGTTPNSLIAYLSGMMSQERPLSQRALLGEIMARREITGFSRAHTLEKYELLTPIQAPVPGKISDPPPSMAYYTEKGSDGFVVPHLMIRSRASSPFDYISTLSEAVAQLTRLEGERPETRDNVIQVVVKRPHELISQDQVFADHLLESLNEALKSAPPNLRLSKVTFLVDREGQYPDYFQFERSSGETGPLSGKFAEDIRKRHLPDILYNLMEIRRYDNFNLWRDLDFSDRQFHIYYGRSKEQPKDYRLLGSAMVNEAQIKRAADGKLLEIPEVEGSFVSLTESMQGSLRSWRARAKESQEKDDLPKSEDPPRWNRMFLNVSPVMDMTDAEVMDYAVKLAERHATELKGLQLEKVVVKARLKDGRMPEGYRTVLVRITNPTGYHFEPQLDNVVRARVQTESGAIESREILIKNGGFDRWLRNPNLVVAEDQWAPADIPVKAMTPLESREREARSKGGVFAYHVPTHIDRVAEKVRIDLGFQEPRDPADRLSERPPAPPSFVEFELDETSVKRAPLTPEEIKAGKTKGKIIENSYNFARVKVAEDAQGMPRAPGQNECGFVIGEHTVDLGIKDSEGRPVQVRRMLVIGDLTHASRGAFSAEETARILGALEYAEAQGIPVDWFVASAGAKIDRQEGVEILDAVTATFRELVNKGRAGREKKHPPVPVNFIVDEYSIGIMSYDIAAGSIAMDSAGVNAMTPRGSSGLTGPLAMAAASKPDGTARELEKAAKAAWPDGLQDIAGYEKVHGPNGETTYGGKDLDKAIYKILLHHFYTYSKNGALVGPRPMLQEDSLDRDITSEAASIGGRKVGDEIRDLGDRYKPGNIQDVVMALRDKGSPPPLVLWEGYEGKRFPSPKVPQYLKPNVYIAFVQVGGQPMLAVAKAGAVTPSDAGQIARAIRKADALGVPVLELFHIPGFMSQTEAMQEGQLTAGESFGSGNVETKVPKLVVNLHTIQGGTKVVVSKQVRRPEEQGIHRTLALTTATEIVIDPISGEKVVSPYRSANEKEAERQPEVAKAYKAFRDEHVKANQERDPEQKKRLLESYEGLKARYEKLFEQEVAKIAQRNAEKARKHHSVERAKEVGSVDRLTDGAGLRRAIVEEMQLAVGAYEKWRAEQAAAEHQETVAAGTQAIVTDPQQFAEAYRVLMQQMGWTPQEAADHLGPLQQMITGLQNSYKSGGGSQDPQGGSNPPP